MNGLETDLGGLVAQELEKLTAFDDFIDNAVREADMFSRPASLADESKALVATLCAPSNEVDDLTHLIATLRQEGIAAFWGLG